jgi:hypothetical protein
VFESPRPLTGGLKGNAGRPELLTRAKEELVLDDLSERPTAYLDDEEAGYIFDDFGKEVSISTVLRLLHAHQWSRKVVGTF